MSSASLNPLQQTDGAASQDSARGTEVRLLASILGVGILIATPVTLLAVYGVALLEAENFGGTALLGGAMMLFWCSTYVFGRYNQTALGQAMRWSRGHLAPLFIGAAWAPGRVQAWAWSAFFVVVLRLLLFTYRRSCRYAASADRPLRVLFAGDAFPPKVDGVVTFTVQALRHLHARGHSTHIVTSVPGAPSIDGASVSRLPGFETPMSPNHFITLPVPRVLRIFQEFRPDVVQLFEASPLNGMMAVYCQIADIPVVFSHHTRLDCYADFVAPRLPAWARSALLLALLKAFYPLMDCHLAVNDYLVALVRRCGGRNVRFWASGVSEGFSPAHRDENLRERLSQGRPDLPLVLHVGRLAPEKCSAEIPAILAATRAQLGQDSVRFAIVGDGISREELEEGAGDDVYFTGLLSGQELWAAYASADVFFSPSTTETFPLVYLEAMRSGVPVAGPQAGGVPHCFDNGMGGLYFQPHDAESAGRAIADVIRSREKMVPEALARGSRFSWTSSMHEFEEAMHDAALLRLRGGRGDAGRSVARR